jgi:hypothetical protein
MKATLQQGEERNEREREGGIERERERDTETNKYLKSYLDI